MNLNPYENTGKTLVIASWIIMAIVVLLGAKPPLWSILLNVGLGGYLIYKGKL